MVQGRPNDKTQLSMKPEQIRRRLRRRHSKFQEDLDTYQDVMYGKPIEEWDLEELARGRPRDKNGGFQGRTPGWITPAVQKEAKRRLLDHTFGQMAGHVDLAVQTIVNLLKSKAVDDNGKPLVDARTKLEASKFIIENIVGKPKAILEVEGSDAVRQFLAAALVLDDGSPAHPVIDGQFEVDEEEEDEPAPSTAVARRRVSDVQPDEEVASRPTRRRRAT